jgi:hypothetical protein
MAEVMKLKDILSDLQDVGASGLDKTAEVQKESDTSASDAKNELVAALRDATETQKTASEQPAEPVTDKLVKVAEDLATSEGEALVKEAHVYGVAMADGFMSRIGQYQEAAGNTKVAEAAPEAETFEKFAEENPEITKQAVELGYHHGKLQIEQLKQAAFQQGYADADAQIKELSQTKEGQEKLAAMVEEIQRGQEKTASDFEKWAETEEGKQAMPHVQQGYQETVEKLGEVDRGYKEAAQEINKQASEVFDRGYNDTIKLLRAM